LDSSAPSSPPPPAPALVLLSSGAQHLSLRASAWAVVCVTLKLAKVFPADRCLALQAGGALSVLEQQRVRQHVEVILLPALEGGEFLLSDLSVCDEAPERALLPGDPRREEHVGREALEELVAFIRESRGAASVRRLQWGGARAAAPTGDLAARDVYALSARRALRRGR